MYMRFIWRQFHCSHDLFPERGNTLRQTVAICLANAPSNPLLSWLQFRRQIVPPCISLAFRHHLLLIHSTTTIMFSASPKSPSAFLSKSPLVPAALSLANPVVSMASSSTPRPLSDFDVGINSSAAWTEHLERHSLSDEEPEEDEDSKTEPGRMARALYTFEGKPEFREITVEAGDALEILKEELGDGWSLVRRNRETGLLPKTYYIVSPVVCVSKSRSPLTHWHTVHV